MKLDKFEFVILLLLLAGLQTNTSRSQTTVGGASPPNEPAPTDYVITARDANSQVWERTTYDPAPNGLAISHIHRYIELGSGLNYLADNQWLPSKEEIDIRPDGVFQATNGQHQAFLPNNIYDGEIELITPEGVHLYSRPAGLSYDDGTNTVLIGILTNSVGYLAASNQVIYPDAFTGCAADLRYTYTKIGFEQDVILKEQPPAPASLNLNPERARIQVLTEFFDPPTPKITAQAQPASAGESADQQLDFGGLEIGRGRAFLLGTNSPLVRVNKHWMQLDGRQFLVEEVPTATMAAELESLPPPVTQAGAGHSFPVMARHLVLPPQRLAKNQPSKARLLAKARPPEHGLVLDYVTINRVNITTDYTFEGNTTYYISSAMLTSATNTIDGGAVIKYTNSALCEIGVADSGCVISTAGPDNPAVLTSMNDNSVGETISGSTGSPAIMVTPYLVMNVSSIPSILANLRFAFAGIGLEQSSAGTSYTNISAIWNCQFANCTTAISVGDYDNDNTLHQQLYNVLFSHCKTAVANQEAPYYDSDLTIGGENVTADVVTNFLWTWSGDGAAPASGLTNSILTGVQHQIYSENTGGSRSLIANTCFVASGNAGVYAIGPQGDYYLPTDSPCINAGNETASAAGFADATTQTNQIPDTGTVDLGYHHPVGNDSTGTDFWLAFYYTDNGDPDLSLYISSLTAANGTVSIPGLLANGPVLTFTGCGDTSVNGTYALTSTPTPEQNAYDFGPEMYVKGSLQVVSCNNGYEWEIIDYDNGTDSYTPLYYQFSDYQFSSLNGSSWTPDSGSGTAPTTTACAQVPFSQTFTLAPETVTNVVIPLEAMIPDDSDEVTTNGIHVVANQPVSVYAFNYVSEASTAFTAYPTSLLGTNYCVMARQSDYDNYGDSDASQFAIVATEDNTTVTNIPSSTAGLEGHDAGVPYTISLNKGETYQISSADDTHDVTGTLIQSDKPIAVLAGANGALVPNPATVSENPLSEELLPTESWGTNVLALAFANRPGGDLYRVLTAEANTVTVLNNGEPLLVTNLAAGEFFETNLTGSVEFQSTQPIQVAQFANGVAFDDPGSLPPDNGDPTEMLLPPVGHYLTAYTIETPTEDFDTNDLNIIVPASATSTTLLDTVPLDSTVFTAIGTSGYYGAQIPVLPGTHTVSSSQPVEVQVYGIGNDDAYVYFGGIVDSP